MSIRLKILLAFFTLATLPLITLWGAQAHLQKEYTLRYTDFLNNTLIDWTDGEFENINFDASVYLKHKIDTLQKIASYQSKMAMEVVTSSDKKNQIEKLWLHMDHLRDVDLSLDAFHEILLMSGEHYFHSKYMHENIVEPPLEKPWFQKVMTSKMPLVYVENIGRVLVEPELVMASPILSESGEVLGVSAIHFKLPEIFPKPLKGVQSNALLRNNNIEGFLLNISEDNSVNVMASQRRDYNSPRLLWNIPFLPDVLENKIAIVERLKREVLELKRVLVLKTSFKDQNYLWAFSPVGSGNLILASLTPLDTILAQIGLVNNVGMNVLNRSKMYFLWVWVLSLLLAFIVSVFFASFFVHRLAKISRSLDKAEEGKPLRFEYDGSADEITSITHKIEDYMRNKRVDKKDNSPN